MCFAPKQRAPFSTSQLPKVVRHWGVLHILTSKCPQRRALFRHRNFQKSSDTEVCCACWPPNVLRATMACTFSTSQLPAQSDKIPVAYLKLLEAELGHIVNFGNKPLTVGAVESQLQAVKPAGKRLDVFLTRYGQKAPPSRIAAKIKMAAALLKELQFWNITICVGCWLFGFWCGFFVHVWKPVSFFPIPHYWTRSFELFQAWYTIHISHSDVAWYWESLSGIPILAPGATVVFAAVCKKFLKSHILELMWVGGILQRMMTGMDF